MKKLHIPTLLISMAVMAGILASLHMAGVWTFTGNCKEVMRAEAKKHAKKRIEEVDQELRKLLY